jgi:NitT/TauT family transport system permease protein
VIATLAALPILAIAPMFLLWFGTGLALKIALAAILAGVVIAARTATSDNAISPELTEFLDANSISSATRTRKVTFPASLEWTLVAIPSAANAAFLGVFIGEFVAADKGIGYRILRAGALYQVDVVLANTLLALIMLLVIQWAVGLFRYQVGAAARYASLDPIHRHSG